MKNGFLKLNISVFVSAVSLMAMTLCSAQTNLVFNGDFELPAIPSLSIQPVIPTGWGGTAYIWIIPGAPGDPNESGHFYVSPESGGQYVLFGSGTFTQTVTVATAGKYDLSWFDNCRDSQNRVEGIPVNPYDVQIISIGSGDAVYSSGQIQTEEDNGMWVKREATVDLAAGDYILQFNSGGVYGYYCPLVDNVSLTGNAATPFAETWAATSITNTAAVLNGSVNPMGVATTARFEYGLTAGYGSPVGVTLAPDDGTTAQTVSATLTGLQPGTTYHYRLTATNGAGTGCYGSDATFTTVAANLSNPTSGSWQPGPPLLTARDQFAGGVLDGKLIVFGGNRNPDGGSLLSTELLDPAAGPWAYKADNGHNGGDGVEELSGAVVNGKFYVVGAWGGGTPYGVFNFVEEYDPLSDTWTSKAPMPTTRASATAVAYNNKIYVFGGYYDNDFGTARTTYTVVEAYDPANDTWATETYMPTYLQSPSVAVVGNKAYVIGGAYGSWPNVHPVTDVSVYDFVSRTWSTNSCAPLPTPAGFTYSGAGPVKDGKIYLIGGYPTGAIPAGEVNSNNWSTCFYIYDTVSNTWSSGDPLPGGQVEYGFRAIIGDDLWVAGGDIAYNLNGSGEDLISGAVWKHSLSNIVVSQTTVPATNNVNGANFVWARRIASTVEPDDELAMGLAMDSKTNLYVCGWFDGINDFGGVTLTNKSGGGQDLFVGKYNSAGVLQWARRAGSDRALRDEARGVGVDNVGNVYVTGGFSGTADFGTTNLTASEDEDFFLAKYDSAGTLQWVRQNANGDPYDSAYGTSLAVDGSGNSYAVGYYDGNGVTLGATPLANPGDYNVFLVKYNSAGTQQWAKAIAGSNYVYSTKVVLDAVGNVCLVGTFEGDVTVGGKRFVSAGGRDAFVAKFSSAGTLQWASQMGGTGEDMAESGVAVDTANNVYVSGGFSSSRIVFGGISLTNMGSSGAFVVKYNSAGTPQWARRFGGSGLNLFTGVTTDLQGNVYATGCISTNTTMGDPFGLNGWDAMVVKYDASGSVKWVQTAGGSGSDIGCNVLADPAGNTYVNGWFQDAAAFGTNTLYSQGYWNFFLAKLPANIPRDLFAGTYSPLVEFDNTIKNGVAIQQTTKPLAVSQTDATHYSVQLSSPAHPAQGSFSFAAERVGNRIQNVDRPITMQGWELWDFFMMSDGTNGAFASISQESADPKDISFQVGSWSSFKGSVTLDDFVGTWTGESYGNDNLSSGLNPGDFVSQSGGTTIVSKVDSTHIHMSSPGGVDQMPLSLTLRVSGNEAYLESSPVNTGTSIFHEFRLRTDGQKVVYCVVGQELNDATDVSVSIGLGVKVKGTQTVTFPMLPAKGVGDADFSPGATASSGLAVTYTSSFTNVATIVAGKIHIVGMGKTIITAKQAGNNNWNPAPDATQELTVGKAVPVITWANPAAIVYGTLLSTAQLNAKASVSGALMYSPAAGVKLPAGTNTLSVTFTPADTNRYSSAAKSVALIVNQASQTITFKPLPIVALGATNFNPGAVSSSGLTVEYASANPAVAEIVGGLIHVTGAGTAVITASQPGNADVKAAAPVPPQTLTVKANLTADIPGGGGTVTGTGLYLPGTNVALTAKPALNNTFLRWEDGSQATARSLVMPNANTTVSAWFGITTNVPKPVIADPGSQRAMVGVPFTLALDITSDSLPAVTVTGLPSGLAYIAAMKTIAGVPTVSATNKLVTVKAVNVNKTPGTNTFFITVDPLPSWAQGAFNGAAGTAALGSGSASMSVTALGAASGKLTLRGTNLTFSSKSYSAREGDGSFTLVTTASVGKVAWPMTLSVSVPAITDPAGIVPPTLSKAEGVLSVDGQMTLYRSVWKDAGMVTVLTNLFTGYYTAVLPGGSEYGSGYLLFTVDKLGGVKTTGKLADGTVVSLAGTLIVDETGRAFAVLYTAPVAYKGGSLFGLAEFFRGDAGARVTVRLLDHAPFIWQSLNPMATSDYYAGGFSRDLGLTGGWYDTLGNLYGYYSNRVMTVGTDGAPVPELLVGTNLYTSAWWNPDGITLTVVTNRLGVMTGFSAPKPGTPVKVGANVYDYTNPTNAVGLTIALTRATGVFTNSFKAWFDYGTTHTSKLISYEGVLTPERENKDDGIAGRGFFLWADTGQYLGPLGKPVPYSFSWSYDLKIQDTDRVLVQGGSLPDIGNGAITVSSFYIGKYEVTWAGWQTVRTWATTNGYDIGSVGVGSADNHPVQMVNWYDCVKWCNARSQKEGRTPVYYTDSGFTQIYKAGEVLEPFVNAAANGYRLPTDVEWEFAARGGTQSLGYEYGGGNDLNGVGWYDRNSGGSDKVVGTKAANELGLYDMSGNVWEWCSDWYPGCEGSARVARGGSWGNDADYCRSACRSGSTPGGQGGNVGFRAVRTLP